MGNKMWPAFMAIVLSFSPGLVLAQEGGGFENSGQIGGPSAWATVTVNQMQSGSTGWLHINEHQDAYIKTSVAMGGEAAAVSEVRGSQDGVVSVGPYDEASLNQAQQLSAGARLQWDANSWPAQASADTFATLAQVQSSDNPGYVQLDQQGWTNQQSVIGDTISSAQSDINQVMHKDAEQAQSLSGETHAEGWIMPRWPSLCGYGQGDGISDGIDNNGIGDGDGIGDGCGVTNNLGGQLIQTVEVMVRNVLTF